MPKKLFIGCALILPILVILPLALIVLVASIMGGAACNDDPGSVSSVKVAIDGDTATLNGKALTSEQHEIVQEIIGQGRKRDLSEADIVTAIATGYQESGLRNLRYGDADSKGVFQQRPSQGWGTVEQILHVPYAVGKFYDELERIPNRSSMTEQAVAEEVQRPLEGIYNKPTNRFANWLPLARALVGGAGGVLAETLTTSTYECAVQASPNGIPQISQSFGGVGDCPIGTPAGVATTPQGQQIQLCEIQGGVVVEANFGVHLDALLTAARRDGIIFSGYGYRDSNAQISLRRQHCGTSQYAIYEMPGAQCSPNTAIPGTSMHELGQAWDGVSQYGGLSYGDPAHQWLRKKAINVFKEHPTEPWHWTLASNPRH